MDNEEIIEQQNSYYMAGYPSRRSERKMNKDEIEKESKTEIVSSKDFNINQIKFCSSESSIVKQMLTKFTEEQQKGHTEIEIDGVRFSNISEMLQYMNKQKERIEELEAQNEEMKCCGNCWYFNIDKNIGIGNLFCNLKEMKNEYCKNKDHWKFLRR